jgi:dTDP-4-amino-4,6-dideoxygalactose transaminase
MKERIEEVRNCVVQEDMWMGRLGLTGGEPLIPGGLKAKWPIFQNSDRKAMLEALDSGCWCRLDWPEAQKSQVAQFEKEFAAWHGAAHCVAVVNGTAALETALAAGGVEAGDEVLVSSVTFIASATAPLLLGAIPIFVDISPDTYQIDPAAMEQAISGKTRAAVVVHYGGRPVDLDAIGEIARRRGIFVVEDAAHAHGSEWRGRKVGAHINAGAFSFQSSKSLSCGEGGAVICDDEELAAKAFAFHHIGRVAGRPFYEHHSVAQNFRMTELQGALLRTQLRRLQRQTAIRQRNAEWLWQQLEPMGLRPLRRDERITQRGFYFCILRYDAEAFQGVPRDKFLAAARAEGIPFGNGYGVPVYKNIVFAENRFGRTGHPVSCSLYGKEMDYGKVRCPAAERALAEEQITLGSHYLMNREGLKKIVRAVGKIRDNLDEVRGWVCG